MYTKIHWLHLSSTNTRLGIMARPRGGEWLAEEMEQFRKQGVQIIVSLLEPAEIRGLGLLREEALSTAASIRYINYPIPYRGLPNSIEKTRILIDELTEQFHNGATIVIHCRMGIGRSSIIAGCVLLQLGYSRKELIGDISKARGLSVPDTPEQSKWLLAWKPSNK
ncbi:hypothetical protein [Paraflavitalea pollutisoli]|uniref:phosphatase domain-containing putative toxin n=1 Tax=Paraflavitalea pollutisoli TaxID=3034143 RepID=UPI0023ED1EC4|nr:hypothetical protein [Paraflavitalea sp. H1-2-19X]